VLLADEFYFLAHDDATGKPRLNPTTAGLGLAAALIGELVFLGRLTVSAGTLRVVDPSPPADPLAHTTLDHIVQEVEHRAVRIWLSFLAKQACDAVAQRLWRAGLVRQETTRRLLRQQVRYVPVDPNIAASPQAMLSTRLRQYQLMREPQVYVAGLAVATGLDRTVLSGAPRATYDFLGKQLDTLATPLQELLRHTQGAVGDAVLSHRI